MPPTILNMFRSCFQRPVENGSSNAIWKLNKKVEGEFNFIVPRNDFANFADMKPKDGAILTVGQYMFLYMYIVPSKDFKEPGPDFERVLYYFWDNSSLFLMKGWVPTTCTTADEKSLLSNLNKKIKHMTPCDTKPVYIKENSPCNDASKNPTRFNNFNVGSELKSESRMVPPKIFAGPPHMKSTYNWGVINTWSRHMAPESEDYHPVFIYDRISQAAFPSDSNIRALEMLDRDIENVIAGKPINDERVSKSSDKLNGMVVSTIDTRDRKIRPLTARGQRTRHAI